MRMIEAAQVDYPASLESVNRTVGWSRPTVRFTLPIRIRLIVDGYRHRTWRREIARIVDDRYFNCPHAIVPDR